MNYTEFAQKIKVKYPEYQEMDDLELSQKIVSKYPEYKDVVEFGQPIPTNVPESKPTEIPLNESETPKAIPADIGLSQSFAKGLTFGTAPLIAGGVDVLRNIGKNISSGNLDYLKDTGKSFEQGRKRFLESQGQYEKEAPVAATLADIAGGLAMPVGSAGAVAKGLSTLQKIKQGAKVGSALGGAYGLGTGLSENQDKAVDIAKGLKGAGIGAGIGALGGTLATSIPQGIKKLVTSKDVGRKLDYIIPSGTQKKTIENIIENPKVQKEAVKKGFNMNYDIYLDDASKRIVGINNEIKKIANEAYKDIPDTIKIDLTKNNTLGKMDKAILDFEKSTKWEPNLTEIQKAKDIFNNIKKQNITNIISKIPERENIIKYKNVNINLADSVRNIESKYLSDMQQNELNILTQKANKNFKKYIEDEIGEDVSELVNDYNIENGTNLKFNEWAKTPEANAYRPTIENVGDIDSLRDKYADDLLKLNILQDEYIDGKLDDLSNIFKKQGFDVSKSRSKQSESGYLDLIKNNNKITVRLSEHPDYLSDSDIRLKLSNSASENSKILNDYFNKQNVIFFDDFKDLTNTLYENANKASKNGDYRVSKMYSQMRKALVEARDEVPQIKKASALYEDMMNAKSKLENALGVDLENPKNVSTKILTDLRDNKGSYVTEQVEEAVNILKNHPETKHLADITDKMKLAQTSYDLRPKEESKLLSAIASKGKSLIQELTGTSPAEKARNLAKRLETGQITKEQLSESFNLVGSPLFEESINKLIQGQKAYGGKLSTAGKGIEKMKLGTYTLPRITIKELLKEKE